MPDILKEMRQSLAEGVQRLIDRDALQRAVQGGGTIRSVGGGQDFLSAQSSEVQNFFTTGYNSGTQTTTTAFLVGFSPLDGTDILTA
jgi:hypothetical protein